MGKSTISMAMFNSFLLVYQRISGQFGEDFFQRFRVAALVPQQAHPQGLTAFGSEIAPPEADAQITRLRGVPDRVVLWEEVNKYVYIYILYVNMHVYMICVCVCVVNLYIYIYLSIYPFFCLT